jgi:integrase
MAHPGALLSEFEPPAGRALVKDFVDSRWGAAAAGTYKKQLTVLRSFFRWLRDAGNLGASPTDGLIAPPVVERKKRLTISPSEAKRLLHANPEPRDQVPLRVLLTTGLPKAALRHLRFADFDTSSQTVSYKRRTDHTLPVAEDELWEQLQALRDQRHAKDNDYVLPAQVARMYNPKPHEFAAMERDGVIDAAGSYLFQRHDGRWFRALVEPTVRQGNHGTHRWWYRCLWSAGLVPPGVKKGFPMQSARYTFGRRQFTRRGSLKELQQQLGGLSRAGSVSDAYKNQDADSLDSVLRRALLRVPVTRHEATPTAIGVDGDRAPRAWWKQPVRVFAIYVDDERDLIELSRVSVEMLRVESSTSVELHEAAETLTRAVTAAELVERARAEARGDHPLLHGHSLVAIWSAFEVMVGDLIETSLLWWPPALARAATEGSVPRPVGQPAEEWAAAVRQALDRKYQKTNRNPRSPRRLDHYEWLLGAVGLAADPQDRDPRMAGNLWELQQIRNVFAHKRGVADQRLVQNCPSLPVKPGERIRVDRSAWSDFLVTTVLYADMLTRRMKRSLGLSERLHRVPAPAIRYPV